MKGYECPATVTQEGNLELPKETSLTRSVPHGHDVRVIVLVPESTADEAQKAWSNLTAEQFLAGYSDADSIYGVIPI